MERTFESWEKDVIRCIRCGACQNVCPVFKELQAESTVARGKIRLVRAAIEHKVELTKGFAEKMSLCLMCKACVANCGSGVRVDKLIEIARKEVAEQKGLSATKRMIFQGVLKNRRVFHTGMKVGSRLQGMLFHKTANGQGMNPRNTVLGIDQRRLLSPLAEKPFRDMYPEVVPVPGAKMKVAFFTGCMINYMYTNTGVAVVNLLQRNGVEVVIPKMQSCCGTPVRINGDYPTAKEMAKANIEVLLQEDYDAIVVACGTCGLALKEEYAELLAADPVYAEKAKRLGAKVKDITELLVSLEGFAEKLGSLPIKVTYHDPCHLVRGLKVKDQPRQLIKSIKDLELIEMKKPDTCCGAAGSFSLYHYELSTKINDHKIEDIQETEAEYVVTGCGACKMHILDGLNRNHSSAKVLHTAELLDMAGSDN